MQQIPAGILEIISFQHNELSTFTEITNLHAHLFIMKVSTILSLLGLLSTSIAAPSHSEKRDVNIFLHEPESAHVEANIPGPPFPEGTYIISSLALDQDDFAIGRALAEDKSLSPKKIITVPRDDNNPQQQVITHFIQSFSHPAY